MRKLLLIALTSPFFLACNSNPNKETSSTGTNADMQTLYQQNLATVKQCITDFENKDLNAYAANIADSAIWQSPVYGDTVTTKAHWIASLKYWTNNWDSLHLSNPIFLPGVDTSTNQMDGSVRYYGRWDGVNKATGIATHLNFYGDYEFNKDHKIIYGGDYFDVGGLLNAVSPKKK
jgi:limonene-1,2-epoxide hydrolase